MANIKVNDLLNLNLTGGELFNDSESFLTELSDESEQIGVIGGKCFLLSWYCCTPTVVQDCPPDWLEKNQ